MLNYSADRRISINNEAVGLQELEDRPHNLRGSAREDDVHHGRWLAAYGEIITVIDAAKGAGEKVGIVTEGMRRAAGGTGHLIGSRT